MKKFLIIVIALAAAGGSAYVLFEKGMEITIPAGGVISSSASSEMQDFMDTLLPESSSSSSEDTLLMDAGLTSSSSSSSLSASSSSRRVTTLSAGAYADYKAGVIGNGEASVLFFHDKNDAASKATETAIKALYKTGNAEAVTYRVDIDTFASLKTKYSVMAGDTLVVVDGQGTATKTVSSPSSVDLSALLN